MGILSFSEPSLTFDEFEAVFKYSSTIKRVKGVSIKKFWKLQVKMVLVEKIISLFKKFVIYSIVNFVK